MKGDVVLIDDAQRPAARALVDVWLPEAMGRGGRFAVTVAGESGSGKSTTARALAEEFAARGLGCAVFQQDDYFRLPPKTNDRARREDISWVGPGEVRLDLLDEHLAAARAGAARVTKPLVIYAEDRITEETIGLSGVAVAVAEGTYTTLLANADRRVFIARTYHETLEDRRRRGREPFDPFIERVLEIEHRIISPHRARADAVIDGDYRVEFLRP
ncbi:MAG: zeta toxin family protein [Acidimicrobiia bacterium]|nr:zeta toxin family protein [Acidimicrobiia bacterium]